MAAKKETKKDAKKREDKMAAQSIKTLEDFGKTIANEIKTESPPEFTLPIRAKNNISFEDFGDRN